MEPSSTLGERKIVIGPRIRWLVGFTILLLASSAVPVFASDTPVEAASAPVESGLISPPGDLQVQKGLEEAEQKEVARLQELQMPAFVDQREKSRDAFADLSDADAQELLLESFAPQMASLNADPARYLSDVELLRTYNQTAATVSDEGDGSLLEAGIPVRTEDSEGDLAKVDLSLEVTDTGFEPANPLTELHIPQSADEAIEVGQEGLAISVADAEEGSEAEGLGEKNVWFSEAQEDTDLLVAPISSGVELFDQLRSAESPQTLHFELQLPEGTEVRENGAGGADISKDGEAFAYVAPPSAVDAQGTPVPVDLEVQGQAIAIHVPHRQGDFAYPILVDPAIMENWGTAWYYGTNNEALDIPGVWGYSTSDPTETYILHSKSCLNAALCSPSGRGLFISSLNRNIPGNIWGQWYYNVPGATTYIPSIYPDYSAYLNPFWRNNGNCSWEKYKEPHDYDGAYDAAGNWVYLETDRAQWVGTATIFTKAKGIAFGMGITGGVNIPCWRNIMLGGTVIRLDDPEAPSLSSVNGIPSTWVRDAPQFTITANVSDPGLGVQNVTMSPKGSPVRYFTPLQSQCPGIKTKPCPASSAAQLSANGTLFDEGEKGVEFSAYDPTGKTSNTISKTIRVDKVPPEVTLAGQLAVATDEDEGDTQDPEKWDPLPLPVYNLEIKAEDGKITADPATKRSGVERIEVFLDGKTTPEKAWSQPCPNSSCSMAQTYQLKVSGLAMGKHTLEVKVKDFVGKLRERKIEFEYFPATGMKDDYLMHYFPLDDGQGNEAEEEHPRRPELAVNVMNGNLVYREQDIDVEGAAIDLEVERYYNSQLPDSENTEWGDGWTLAQTPRLEPEDTGGSPAADQTDLIDTSGAIETDIALPTEVDAEHFDAPAQITLTREAGGYALRDETGETAATIGFDESGKTEELRAGDYTRVDYDYEGGELAEIAVEDPGSVGGSPQLVKYPGPPAFSPRYSSAFGTAGSGNGQMQSPSDVALDPAGNIWVADTANNRVLKYNAKGEFLAKYGSFGSGDGQFNRPTAIALTSPNGYVLVADSGNNRIQKLTPAGAFHSKFGSKGTGNGQFAGAGPEGIIFDPRGYIWVSDTYGGRVEKFSVEGQFLEVIGSKGSGPEQFGEPSGIDLGPEGDVFVADRQNNRVSAFTAESEGGHPRAFRQFGTAGSGEGQLNRPEAIDVDANGNVWVGDRNNGRIQRFDLNGEYLSEFGPKGSGAGQFSYTALMGVATNPTGSIWVTDGGNNRVEKWVIPPEVPAYSSSFGSAGSGNGQLSAPGDVAVDTNGDLWVVDKANNRIEKFNPKGEYVSKFGSFGTANGQFNRPTSIAIDAQGNLWVTDAGNNRVQKFSKEGAFLAKFGSYGTASNQFNSPEGITIDDQGNLWVSDTKNGRLQRLSPSGAFLGTVGTKGSAAGQFGEPMGIDFGPEGSVWIADWQNNRVTVFGRNDQGAVQFSQQFGTAGSGEGQFNHPDAIDLDAEGNVWVGDQGNGRVQLFNRSGEYITQFGAKGSGQGQFNFTNPMGIATDDQGGIWVTDVANNRIQEWLISSRVRIEDDPSVKVSTSAGLIDAVEGEEAGEHSYDHDGERLVSHDGPAGETQYSYDSAGRLAGIVLPNGTSALIQYNASYGRVSSVTVDQAGSEPAKTTYFEYSDTPRRTVVIPPDAPHVTYDIGEDGSVLKWWNTLQPPNIDDLSGSLYFDKEKPEPISIGDHNLIAQAHSEEGIASIQFIANGNVLVDEMKCEKPQVIECKTLINEWVTETGAHAPGILNLEVIVTDRLGATESKRFWVNIPYTPPEPPGAIPAPKFKDIKQFREDYGLEVVFPVANELELNDRIFDLIGAWHNPQTPAGEVARASWERWGVPLRAADVAELEYREHYIETNVKLIEEWANANYPNTYAGYYVNHRAGGTFHVGFTQGQASRLSELKDQLPLAAPDRSAVYPTAPATPRTSLASAYEVLDTALDTNNTLRNLVTELGISESGNNLSVGTTNVSETTSVVHELIGSQVPLSIYPTEEPVSAGGRNRTSGRMRAGDRILNMSSWCTAAFGAFENRNQKSNGQDITARFVLTAGHCFSLDSFVHRSDRDDSEKAEDWAPVGQVARNAFHGNFGTDGLAIRAKIPDLVPHGIFGSGGNLIPVGSPTKAQIGNTLCFSGARLNGVSCGEVTREVIVNLEGVRVGAYNVKFNSRVDHGDSGGPVWNPRTGATVGVISGFYRQSDMSIVTPLLHPEGLKVDRAPGILHDPDMLSMHIITGD